MPKHFLMLGAILSGFVIFLLVLTGCANTTSAGTTNRKTIPNTTILITKQRMLFSPFILAVQPNTTVTWQNETSDTQTIATTSEKSNFVNQEALSLTVTGRHNTSFTFTKPGLYHYYNKQQSAWNSVDHRVKADNGFLAADGIIWVQGNISGLPSSATNIIPANKDIFSSYFVAIAPKGTVEWQNLDTDEHAIAPVGGWSAPINPANIGIYTIKGTEDTPPHGGIQRITFNTPGLYYYYCPKHADINATWNRAVSHKDASENPIPMEGFVLVTRS